MSNLMRTEIVQMAASVRFARELGCALRSLADACPGLGDLAGNRTLAALRVEKGHALEALASVVEEGLRNGSTDMASDLGREWLHGTLRTVGLIDGMLQVHRASAGISDRYSAAKGVIGTADLNVERLLVLQASIASFNRVKDFAALRAAS